MNHPSTEFSDTPWSYPPRDDNAKQWRERCGDAVSTFWAAISRTGEQGFITEHGQQSCIQSLTWAIFVDPGDPSDRSNLLYWIGGVCGIGVRGGRKLENAHGTSWRGQKTTDSLCEKFLLRWSTDGWNNLPTTQQPIWSRPLVEDIKRLTNNEIGPQDCWSSIPDGWDGKSRNEETNAQMDLMTFLLGFEEQAENQPESTDPTRKNSVQISAIPFCCVALRILFSETERLDTRTLKHLNFLESLYGHRHINTELLQCTQAAVDRKILNSVSIPGQAEPHQQLGRGITRKL